MASNDTPTLLANASAGQLLDDAKWAEGMAALDIGTRIIVNGPDSPDRASLLRLAELARAVARCAQLADEAATLRNTDAPIVDAVADWHFSDDCYMEWYPHYGQTPPAQSLCAALAATRHTQGEPDA